MFDLKKAMELKKMMESITARLELITVEGKSGDSKFEVIATVSGTKKLKNLHIAPELMKHDDKEYLEDLLITAINRALDNAQNVADAEGRSAAMGGLLG